VHAGTAWLPVVLFVVLLVLVLPFATILCHILVRQKRILLLQI
jgi:hypothetical protein